MARFRPFQVVAPGFAQVDATADGQPALADSGPVAPFAAVQLEPAATGTARAGLGTPDGDWVGVALRDGRLALEVRRTGRTRTLRTAEVGRPARVAFVLCENQVTALVDDTPPGGPDVPGGGPHTHTGWRAALTARRRTTSRLNRPVGAPDLRRPEVLHRFRYAWQAPEGTHVSAGPFGMAGLRDPHLVTHADGRPYERDGRLFLTWTCAGLGGFRQAHWGVFALDPGDPTHLEQTAQVYTERDGLLLGDHAGHLVRDGDRWIVLTSAWGDYRPGSVHVRHTQSRADLLTGVHRLRTRSLPLPTRHATWDPGLARIDGRWHVSFVESASQRPFRFHPALAAGPTHHRQPHEDWHADWHRGLRMRAAAGGLTQCEGPILTRRGDDWWLPASDGAARDYPVFDLDMRRLGRLDAPYPTNIPHPQTVPLPGGGDLLVTFDGTGYAEETLGYGGHGDVLVMRTT